MKMIVGLGNIGRKYEGTRHNVGFMVIDQFAKEHQASWTTSKFTAEVADCFIDGEKVLLVKPSTYMNDSGRAVRPLMDYFRIDLADLLVVHDDMDLPVGKIRLRQKGSAGGHNGIKSIIAHVDDQHFKRLRVGIDHPQKASVVDYVLGRFTKQQQAAYLDSELTAIAALDKWVTGTDFGAVMNEFN